MTYQAQDSDTLVELIAKARGVLENGPRSAMTPILKEIAPYGTMDSVDALRIIREAIDAANAAGAATALGNDLEAQEHEARFAGILEGLDDLILDLALEGEDNVSDPTTLTPRPCPICGSTDAHDDHGPDLNPERREFRFYWNGVELNVTVYADHAVLRGRTDPGDVWSLPQRNMELESEASS